MVRIRFPPAASLQTFGSSREIRVTARFDPYPSAIVYCVVENDVRLALNVAAGSNFPPSIRSGGHCTAGFSAGSGFLIDVSNLNQVVIDPVDMTATIGCGCGFAKLNAALDEYGFHVPGGECDERDSAKERPVTRRREPGSPWPS